MNYRKALTQSQADDMKQFLHALLRASDVARECGVKPDIEVFMKAWRGQPVTEEGKAEHRKSYAREYDRVRREKKKGKRKG